MLFGDNLSYCCHHEIVIHRKMRHIGWVFLHNTEGSFLAPPSGPQRKWRRVKKRGRERKWKSRKLRRKLFLNPYSLVVFNNSHVNKLSEHTERSETKKSIYQQRTAAARSFHFICFTEFAVVNFHVFFPVKVTCTFDVQSAATDPITNRNRNCSECSCDIARPEMMDLWICPASVYI